MLSIGQPRPRPATAPNANQKSQLGQFFTPPKIAAFMAGLFPDATGNCRLLDAGAGMGSLSLAFLQRWKEGGLHLQRVDLDAFEIDDSLHPHLLQTLEPLCQDASLHINIRGGDFIHTATKGLPRYTHAILNPPYKKINSHSAHRLALRRLGIETVNLYSAFVALAVAHGEPGAQIVAILPRSFCNGPYYRPFREFILQRSAIRHLHLFHSRTHAFKDDDVLQENIIISLECGAGPGPVTISSSTDDSFADLRTDEYPFEQIVFPADPEQFIHIPLSPERDALELSPAICHRLDELGIMVSTGPVVDFRLKEYLRPMPEAGTVPLLYPAHFGSAGLQWPLENIKKPNAIQRNADTEKWLYPTGFYCVVRRFSSKEEKRRIVASVVDPALFDEMPMLGFENHLNVFHEDRHGLPEALARGLSLFLNTGAVDAHFRRFNGHTQVNATDLRRLKYPSRAALMELGKG